MVATRFTVSRVVREITHTIAYGDTTSARIFTLPKGARLIDWIINVKTAFAGGAGTLNVGISGTANYFISGLDVSSVGNKSPSVLVPGHIVTTLGQDIYAQASGSDTSGSVDITLLFSMEQGVPFT